jgi:hypothetical protein
VGSVQKGIGQRIVYKVGWVNCRGAHVAGDWMCPVQVRQFEVAS